MDSIDEEKGQLTAVSPNERKLRAERFERETSWRSCCFTVDSRACIYATKVVFSAATLVFCMVQIARDGDGCSNALLSWYTATIGTVVGGLLAHAGVIDKEENKAT